MTLTGPASYSYISQRLKLNYADWGNTDKPPLLLVHGGRDHCRSWDWVAEELKEDWHIIAPDLRGHGDSDWVPDGSYPNTSHVYDIAQLIHQKDLAPVTIVAHSMGGDICLRYAGLYPETVKKMVIVEGTFPDPKFSKDYWSRAVDERVRSLIENKRNAASRQPRRYATLEEAYKRMKDENKFLTDEQARHLTVHGIKQNEDGTYTWKFDNYVRIWPNIDIPPADVWALWERITCPLLVIWGKDSFATPPDQDDRMSRFRDAKLVTFENAGHWPHHDQFDKFMAEVRNFL